MYKLHIRCKEHSILFISWDSLSKAYKAAAKFEASLQVELAPHFVGDEERIIAESAHNI